MAAGGTEANTGAGAASQLGAIEHIVVLMLENRSFDHMLGYLYRTRATSRRPGSRSRG